MLCQYCNQNEADYRFFINYDGQVSDVHLCSECTERLNTKFYEFYDHIKPFMGGWRPEGESEYPLFEELGCVSQESAARPGRNPFPTEVDEGFRQRRRLAEMRVQLQKAVQAEEYETAARLRDEIQSTEKANF